MQVTSQWIRNFQSASDNGLTDVVTMSLPPNRDGCDIVTIIRKFAGMVLAGCVSTIVIVVAKSNANNFKCDNLRSFP